MKKLMELSPKEWLEFKNDHQNYSDVLDYAGVN
jgi:hypothetical protein